ncbi:MAG: hypothetical protein ACKVXR_04315 [Planctomycetota bacterium]
MRISIQFGAAILALSAGAMSCSTIAGQSAQGDKVYLVGVAGGG